MISGRTDGCKKKPKLDRGLSHMPRFVSRYRPRKKCHFAFLKMNPNKDGISPLASSVGYLYTVRTYSKKYSKAVFRIQLTTRCHNTNQTSGVTKRDA